MVFEMFIAQGLSKNCSSAVLYSEIGRHFKNG